MNYNAIKMTPTPIFFFWEKERVKSQMSPFDCEPGWLRKYLRHNINKEPGKELNLQSYWHKITASLRLPRRTKKTNLMIRKRKWGQWDRIGSLRAKKVWGGREELKPWVCEDSPKQKTALKEMMRMQPKVSS